MPGVMVYLSTRTYLKLIREASKYEVTEGKMAQIIIETYFEHLERERDKSWLKGNTESSTSRT